ncbi:MAG: CBS domain-containing protein [Planctomycetota bacterium]
MTSPHDRTTVQDWMTESLILVGPDEPLFAALERMAEDHVRHVLVLDGEGGLRGIVSNRDVVRATALNPEHRLDLHSATVAQVMTPAPLTTVSPGTPVEEAARAMVDRGVNALPVLDKGRPVGIVSSEDLLRVLAHRCGAPPRPEL